MKPPEKYFLCRANSLAPGWATSSSGKNVLKVNIFQLSPLKKRKNTVNILHFLSISDPSLRRNKTEKRKEWRETKQNTTWTRWKEPHFCPKASTKWSEFCTGERKFKKIPARGKKKYRYSYEVMIVVPHHASPIIMTPLQPENARNSSDLRGSSVLHPRGSGRSASRHSLRRSRWSSQNSQGRQKEGERQKEGNRRVTGYIFVLIPHLRLNVFLRPSFVL